ncbi:MAG: hypothetical protein IT201_01785 [Thermoleophilia bacterium]|nr:hypothetical protein [Thermoleophilia bacterium]
MIAPGRILLVVAAAVALALPAAAGAESLGFNNARPLVETGGGTVALVWLDDERRVVVGERRAGNSGFDREAVVAEGAVATPAIAARGGTLAVAWASGGSVYARLRVAGVWQPAERLGAGAAPSLAVAKNRLGIVWHARDESEILFARRSTAASGHWSAPSVLAAGAGERVSFASLAGAGSRFAAVWKRGGRGAWEVELRRSADRGSSWGAARSLGEGGDPAVCLAGGSRVWVGLQHLGGGISVLVSADAGATFTTRRVGDGWFAHLSCSRTRTLVAWEQTPYPPQHPDESAKSFGLALVSAGGTLKALDAPASSHVASPTALLRDGVAIAAWIDTSEGRGLSGALRLATVAL